MPFSRKRKAPRRKNGKSSFARKSKRSRWMISKKNRNTRTVINYDGPTFMPQEYFCNHTFVDTIVLNEATNNKNFNFGILNIFNPNTLLSGESVNGFDQMNVHFARWRAMHGKIEFVVQNYDEDQAVEMTLRPHFTGANASIIDLERENPFVKYRVMGPRDSNRSQVKLSSAIKADTIAKRRLIFDDDGLSNGIGTTPPITVFSWNLLLHTIQEPSTALLHLSVQVKITYKVKWYSRVAVVLS